MTSGIVEAFLITSEGYSPDRVLADPKVNARFIAECHELGLTQQAIDLNRALLNLRKQGLLAGQRPSKRTMLKNVSGYSFAAEIAVRFLERRDGVTLDSIICDPVRAAEFDQLAADIAPGFTPFEYRWAALSLRKQNRLQPEILARVAKPTSVGTFSVHKLDVMEITSEQGLYLFFNKTETLYIGEAANLRVRLKKHLDHSDNKGLARWIWDFGQDELHLEIQTLDAKTPTRIRKALEQELIRSRNPVFNVKR